MSTSSSPVRTLGAPLRSPDLEAQRDAGEVTSFADAPPPPSGTINGSGIGSVSGVAHGGEDERSPLLPIKVAPRYAGPSPLPASHTHNAEIDSPPPAAARRSTPLVLSFFSSLVLIYVHASLLLLCMLSLNSPFWAHLSLPTHRSSLFLPIWLFVLSALTAILSLLAVVAPGLAPRPVVEKATHAIDAVCALVILILIAAVNDLRHRESTLGLIAAALAIVTSLQALATARVVRVPKHHSFTEEPTPGEATKTFFAHAAQYLLVTLPLYLFHLQLVLTFLMLLWTTCLEAYDASLPPPVGGQTWWVDPFASRPLAGAWVRGSSDAFKVFLACETDALLPESMARVAAGGGGAVTKTVLIESERGMPGERAAAWVLDLLRKGSLTSADWETRVCYYDRPGYARSDDAPSSTIPVLNSVLHSILSQSGELARLGSSSPIPSPSPPGRDVDQSGIVLLAEGWGALPASSYAARHPQYILGGLYVNPVAPDEVFEAPRAPRLFSPHSDFVHFFTSVIPALSARLGVWSTFVTFRPDKGRKDRVLSSYGEGASTRIGRSWLQEGFELREGRRSESAVAWREGTTRRGGEPKGALRGRYPSRPAVVLGGGPGTDIFVEEVLGKQAKWEASWSGEGRTSLCEAGGCKQALKELLGL